MTTVYLHLGMPKCASSTIQSHFNRFDGSNNDAGFVYPVAGRAKSGYFSHEPIVEMSSDQIKALVEDIKVEAEGAKFVFISAEALVATHWDRPITAQLVERLNAAFGASNVRLLFLFRNHFSFIESAFAQFLKGGLYRIPHKRFFRRTTGDVEGYCAAFRDANGFDFFDYTYVIEGFRKDCAQENEIEVLSIEKTDLETGDILEELCKKFSLVPPPKRRIKNARFPAKALLGLAYGIERHGFGSIRAMRKGIASQYADSVDGFSPVLHIHGSFADAVALRQRVDALYFKNQFGHEFPALFEPRLERPFADDPQGEIQLTDEDRAWLDGYFSSN